MVDDKSSNQDKYKTLIEQTEATRFQPGESGNPGGRPKDYITEILRRKLLEKVGGDKTNAEIIAEALLDLVKDPRMRGYAPMLKELLDRIEGKVPDTHKIESDVPISIVFKEVEVSKDTSKSGQVNNKE